MDVKQRVVGRFSMHHIALVCCLTLLSRMSGFLRDVLFVKFLGAQSASIISDSFLTAFRIPQVVYEILLGGALGSALIPVLATVMRRDGQHAANRLMTALLIIIGCIMTVIAGIVIYNASSIIWSIAPGFMCEQRMLAAGLLRIMIFVIVISAVGLLCSEAVRFSRSFVITALSQIVYNITFIGGLCWYAWNSAPIEFLAWCVIGGGLMQCMLQLAQYMRSSFSFEIPSSTTLADVYHVMRRIIPSILSAGIAEMSFFIELQFASYLPIGSISLLSYASSFMRLPLGIFVYALMTVIFPDMVRVSTYAPRRLAFIIYEVTKVLWWILLPTVLLMSIYAYDIFATLYYAHPLISAHGVTLQWLLIIKLLSLPLLAFSKVCVDVLYALHKTQTPSMVFLCGTIANIFLNILVMPHCGIYGIALSSLFVALVRTTCFYTLVNRQVQLSRYGMRLKRFCGNSLQQLVVVGIPLGILLWAIRWLLRLSPEYLFFSDKLGLWLWIGPLCGTAAIIMWSTRHYFNIEIYFFKQARIRSR